MKGKEIAVWVYSNLDRVELRKAFSWYCMGVVQATKPSGTVTVEATSFGLVSAAVTITAKAAPLRSKVATWEREVPVGPGITGRWRLAPAEGEAFELLAFFVSGGTMVFTLRQDGSNNLTGTVEGTGGGFFGGKDVPIPVTDG